MKTIDKSDILDKILDSITYVKKHSMIENKDLVLIIPNECKDKLVEELQRFLLSDVSYSICKKIKSGIDVEFSLFGIEVRFTWMPIILVVPKSTLMEEDVSPSPS
jgi:hypothetical protein